MVRIVDLEELDLRAELGDDGRISRVLDQRGNEMGLVAAKTDPLTGRIGFTYPLDAGYTPLVAAIGDSRIANGKSGTLISVATTAKGVTSWLEPLTLGRVQHPAAYNLAVSGSIFSRVGASGAALSAGSLLEDQIPLLSSLPVRPTHCVILCGTNEIGYATSALITLDQIKANCLSVIAAVRALGIRPVIMLDLPRTQASWSATGKLYRNNFNNWLIRNGQTYGAYVVNGNELYTDPANANGDPLAGYNNADGIHPAAKGAYAAGSALASFFNSVFAQSTPRYPSQGDAYDATSNPSGNGFPSVGMFLGTGGGNQTTGGNVASGTVATGWNNRGLSGTTATCVATDPTTTPRTDTAGNWQKVTYSCTTGPATFRLYTTGPASNIVAGTYVQVSADVKIDSATLLDYIQLNCLETGGAGSNNSIVLKDPGAGFYPLPTITSPVTMRLQTAPILISSGSTDVSIRFELQLESGGAAVINFGNVEIRQVTP